MKNIFKCGFFYGAPYSSDGDDGMFLFQVLKRTAQQMTLKYHNEILTVKVQDAGADEWAFPLGRYSMSPIIRAGKVLHYVSPAPLVALPEAPEQEEVPVILEPALSWPPVLQILK